MFGELIFMLLFAPAKWFIQGVAGALHPVRDHRLIIAQRFCIVSLILAVTSLVVFCVSMTWGTSWATPLTAFTVWFLAAAVTGLAGNYIEKMVKQTHSSN